MTHFHKPDLGVTHVCPQAKTRTVPKTSEQARRCLFCGLGDDVRVMTREDAWPEWTRRFTVAVKPATEWRYSLGTEWRQRTQLVGRAPRVRIPNVCQPCNGGWMSRLETAVIPVLEPLILGQSSTLSENDQGTLAMWAVKTALTLNELGNERKLNLPPTLYRHLAEQTEPPPRHRVFAAIVKDEPGYGRWHHFGAAVGAREDSYYAWVLIRRIVFQIVGDFGERPALPFDRQYYERIWPVRGSMAWRPGVVIRRPVPPDWPDRGGSVDWPTAWTTNVAVRHHAS
jgi:hypothetical protein